MLLGSVWHRRAWFSEDLDLGELRRVSWNADCSTRQICWNNDWPTRTLSSLDCSQTLRHHTRTGFSIGTSHRVPCVHWPPYVCSRHVSHLLSAFRFCFLWIIAFPPSDGSTFFIRVYCIEYWRLLRAQCVESSIGIAFPHACEWYRLDLAMIAFSCHFALDLLCYKEEVFVSTRWYIGHRCPWNF